MCQLTLFLDAARDLFLALLQLSEVSQAGVQITQQNIAQIAGNLLAVTGDKGDGVARVYELHGVLHLLWPYIKFLCQFIN